MHPTSMRILPRRRHLLSVLASALLPVFLAGCSTDKDGADSPKETATDTHVDTAGDSGVDTPGETGDTDLPVWYPDADGDGYGAATGEGVGAEEAPNGYVASADDCADADAAIHPDATETCNDRDDDCDGEIDEDAVDATTYYTDADNDGYGMGASPVAKCTLTSGYSAYPNDCDDTSSRIFPGAVEMCDLVDNDCDGRTDEDADDGSPLCDLWEEHSVEDADAMIIGVDDDGDGYGEDLGSAVAAAGDVDGDGYNDIWIGAMWSAAGGWKAGAAYLVSGPVIGGPVTDVAAATLIGPDAGARAGQAISTAGDVNLDGYDDVWVGAYLDDRGEGVGSASLVLGPISGPNLLTDADLGWLAEIGGASVGIDVSGLGDYDGDGIPDAAIGDEKGDPGIGLFAGRAYLVRMDGTWGMRGLEDAAVELYADHTKDLVGFAVAIVGDTTGDGTDDVLVSGGGEETADSAGWVWVVEEPPSDGSYSIGDAATWALEGEAADDTAGDHLAKTGDLNGDGYADYALGSFGDDSVDTNAGAVYVVYGPTAGRTSVADADIKLTGVSQEEGACVVRGDGDVDADGSSDLIIGAYYSGHGGELAGKAYLLHGPLTEGTSSLRDADAVFTGVEGRNYAGWSVDLVGDTNADGFTDLIIGAPYAASTSDVDNPGAAYFFLGQPF